MRKSKRCLLFLLIFVLLILGGCSDTGSENPLDDESDNSVLDSANLPSNETDEDFATDSALISNIDNIDELSVLQKVQTNNLFFSNDMINKIYLIDSTYGNEITTSDIVAVETSICINKVFEYENGRLFEIKINLTGIYPIPADRLFLGYFYVDDNKIIKIDAILEDEFEIIERGRIVCQNDDIKDKLTEEEKGLHHYLFVNGNKCESHTYNNAVETGYFEVFIWERGKGLISYRSGYGALRDYIEIQQK